MPPDLRPGSRARGAVEVSKQIYGVDMSDGRRTWLLTSALLLEPDMPAESDMLVSFSDITSEREDLDRLIYQANHDPLTGLPNRAFVLRRITGALASSDCGRLRAVLFIDLDDLKSTNDTLGHQAGDDLLNAAAARLRQAVGPHDIVGRHGGDEFVLLIYCDTGREDLEALVSRLRARLAKPGGHRGDCCSDPGEHRHRRSRRRRGANRRRDPARCRPRDVQSQAGRPRALNSFRG